MPTTPVAYNAGSPVAGTTQTGSLAIGSTPQNYGNNYGGLIWWMGPEESTGFVIGVPVPTGDQPTPIPGVDAAIGFYRSEAKTNSSFLTLTNTVFNQNFTDAYSASVWLHTNGYWNTYVTTPYEVGERALGGVIAYILQPGDPGYDANVQHGLVATLPVDGGYDPEALWGCTDTNIPLARNTAIGSGFQNTINIIAQYNSRGCPFTAEIAASYCNNLVEGGYSDWYLPSSGELNKLYLNRVAIGGFLSFYWSSTEVDANNAIFQNFTNGAIGSRSKDTSNFFRPIRSF
jgi:hypothetical protein